MRDVVKIQGDRCDGCPWERWLEGRECRHPSILRAKCNIWSHSYESGSTRHRDCPYGNRVITVVMTDEEGKE